MPTAPYLCFPSYREPNPREYFSASDIAHAWNISEQIKVLIMRFLYGSPGSELRKMVMTAHSPKGYRLFGLSTTKTCIISLEIIAQLDGALQKCTSSRWYKLFNYLLSEIQTLRSQYTVGVNFTEIFFQRSEQVLPPHYRIGIDKVVNTRKEYQQQNSIFSYQLGKALLAAFASCSPYARAWDPQNDSYKLDLPPLFTHALEAALFIRRCVADELMILAFGSQIAIPDLSQCILLLCEIKKVREVIFIFEHEDYEHAAARAAFLNEMQRIFSL
ncbi:MAG TPA: hypothetical protein VHD33_01965, partial [Legionellaceae bacterium]|nr:hypothetical protein [Legionellaceae bacterium]